MASVNKVILLGNCGRDPEMRYMASGQPVASVSIATSSRRKDKNTGEMVEDTQWHRVTFYERLAEIVGEYVKKGSPIYVEGRLKYGKYTDQSGVERYTTDIIATEMQLLGGREGMGGGEGRSYAPRSGGAPASGGRASGMGAGMGNSAPAYASRPPSPPPAQPMARPAPAPAVDSGFGDMDDDIPF